MSLIPKETGPLWIALAVVVLLLALNAVSTISGWSPFAPIVNEHIEKQSRAAEVRSKEQRDNARLAEPAQLKTQILQGEQKSPAKQPLPATAVASQPGKRPAPPVVPDSPVAPERPVAPQIPPPPVAPVPPVYIMYYPDGSVRYFTQPVYPAPVYPVQTR